ncbi:hypothetical protein ACVDG3_14990 [Meridianimarinicoccus sp. RP-17]|uniref:hypothetical protein n=1 Tax=Meridianimarinicoccus zhengii TaxID=2056810 RepID=UPI000DAD646F|nr:hypothetical protein [Phycocomes zhengii]
MDGTLQSRLTVLLPAALGLGVFAVGHLLLPPAAPVRLSGSGMVTPPVEAAPEDAAAEEDRAPRHYLQIQQNIASSIPSLGGIVQVQIALAVREQDNARIAGAMQESPADVLAPIQEALRVQAEKAADLAALHASLPSALRMAANARLGTPEQPDPVLEVLVTGLLLSQ